MKRLISSSDEVAHLEMRWHIYCRDVLFHLEIMWLISSYRDSSPDIGAHLETRWPSGNMRCHNGEVMAHWDVKAISAVLGSNPTI